MKRGCLIGIVFVVGMIAAYYAVLRQYFEWPGDAIAALLGGVFASMFISSIIGVVQAWRDARRIRRAEAHEQPRDGEVVAIVGTIRPIDAPLQSPFGGKPCVAYDYELSHVEHHQSNQGGTTEKVDVRDIAGLALTPSVIDTAWGGVRLLSFAMLDAFPNTRYGDPAARRRAASYIAGTTFKPMGVSKVFTALEALEEALTDEDGAVRMDWRMTSGEIGVQSGTLAEKIVGVGETVCAIGRYSAGRHGLFSDGPTSIVRLTPGDGRKARAAGARNARGTLAAATLFFVVSHAMLGAMVYMSETRYTRESPSAQASAISTAVQDGNVQALNRVIRQGADPNVRDASGDTPLHYTRNPVMARALVKAGANVNAQNIGGYTALMLASRTDDQDLMRALLESGASVNLARPDGGNALTDAIEGHGETSDAVALLKAAGATSDLITAANGTALPPDGGEPFATCRAYIAAIHARDPRTMRALTIGFPPGMFESADFTVWQDVYPAAPRFIAGFTANRLATLALGGPTPGRNDVTWHFHVARTENGWRIRRLWNTPGNAAEPLEAPRAR